MTGVTQGRDTSATKMKTSNYTFLKMTVFLKRLKSQLPKIRLDNKLQIFAIKYGCSLQIIVRNQSYKVCTPIHFFNFFNLNLSLFRMYHISRNLVTYIEEVGFLYFKHTSMFYKHAKDFLTPYRCNSRFRNDTTIHNHQRLAQTHMRRARLQLSKF